MLTCDHWWESETQWHRNWKNEFPESWQEIVHTSENGEKHVADVKTENGIVLEFQHSFLPRTSEMRGRAFIQKWFGSLTGLNADETGRSFMRVLPLARLSNLNR
jgi:hypothetical protein